MAHNPEGYTMAMQVQVHVTLKSANSKTGPIPVTTTDRHSCGNCSFKKNGCYADSGPLALHWDKVTAKERGGNWDTLCETVASFPDGQLWRHNQAGDLPKIGVSTIDRAQVMKLAAANHGKRGFTYTHHKLTRTNIDTITMVNIAGFTVNVSADTIAQADALADTGLPVVVVLPSDQTENTFTAKGRKIVVCPATIRDDISCDKCQMCAKPDRGGMIIGFPAHGTSKRKADLIAKGAQ